MNCKSIFLKESPNSYISHSVIPDSLVGCVSSDRSAVLGKQNWCYIYEGSNDYRMGYIDEGLACKADAWLKIFNVRKQFCESLNIDFLQVIIPNKATVLPHFYPESLSSDITFLLKKIMEFDEGGDSKLFIPIAEFKQEFLCDVIFRKNDSHFSIFGIAYLTELILEKIGVVGFYPPFIETAMVEHVGDLGSKFDSVVKESLCVPLWDSGLLTQKKLFKKIDIKPGGLNGIEQVFVNSEPLIDKKIVVFGNSFFERVPSWGMSPIFASLFSEFHFVWSSSMDFDKVRSLDCDFVICQTCERFLPDVPCR